MWCRLLPALAVVTALANVCRAQFTTVINVPPDPPPTSIGSDTQLNLFDEGTLPSSYTFPFQAGLADGSSSNVEVNINGGSVGGWFRANSGSEITVAGGTVGALFDANSGSRVIISGGSVGDAFNAHSGSEVTISSGRVGGGFEAYADSEVTITGGIVGGGFRALPGSKVIVSGGSVGQRFQADVGSDVTISGGEFLLNGAAPTETIVTLTSYSDVFSGTLEDGSPFIFQGGLNDVTLAVATLPPLDTTPMMVNSQDGPSGLRAGQSLTLLDGGVLGENFAVVHATLNINGGNVGRGLEVIGSDVTIAGGRISDNFSAYAGEPRDHLRRKCWKIQRQP